jgi:hypothetical protein
MRKKSSVSGILEGKEFSHMKRFGIMALALTFLMGTVATVSFAQDTTTTTTKKEKKKKKKKADTTTDKK